MSTPSPEFVRVYQPSPYQSGPQILEATPHRTLVQVLEPLIGTSIPVVSALEAPENRSRSGKSYVSTTTGFEMLTYSIGRNGHKPSRVFILPINLGNNPDLLEEWRRLAMQRGGRLGGLEVDLDDGIYPVDTRSDSSGRPVVLPEVGFRRPLIGAESLALSLAHKIPRPITPRRSRIREGGE